MLVAEQPPRPGQPAVVPGLLEGGDGRLDLALDGVKGQPGLDQQPHAEAPHRHLGEQAAAVAAGLGGHRGRGQDLLGAGEVAGRDQALGQVVEQVAAGRVVAGGHGQGPVEQGGGGRGVAPGQGAAPGGGQPAGRPDPELATAPLDRAELGQVPPGLL